MLDEKKTVVGIKSAKKGIPYPRAHVYGCFFSLPMICFPLRLNNSTWKRVRYEWCQVSGVEAGARDSHTWRKRPYRQDHLLESAWGGGCFNWWSIYSFPCVLNVTFHAIKYLVSHFVFFLVFQRHWNMTFMLLNLLN